MCPQAQVNSDHRRIAKVLNFGVIYGLSAFGISQQTEFNPEEGTRFIESYFSKYPGIKGYSGQSVKEASSGHVGMWRQYPSRRRYLPELNASNYGSLRLRCRADGDQHAHSGHRRRHHEDGYDTGSPSHGCRNNCGFKRLGCYCRCMMS